MASKASSTRQSQPRTGAEPEQPAATMAPDPLLLKFLAYLQFERAYSVQTLTTYQQQLQAVWLSQTDPDWLQLTERQLQLAVS